MEQKKKIFPKLKKQIKNFLTDESGEITKKDALGLAAGAAILAGGVETVEAAHSNNAWSHYSPALPAINGNQVVTVSNATCSHVSGVVNGHMSRTPGVNMSQTIHTHSNGHSSHDNY